MYIHLLLCLFVYLSGYVENHEFTPYSQLQSPTTWVIIEFSFCVFVTPFSDSRKTGLHHPYIFIYMTNTLYTANLLLPLPPLLCADAPFTMLGSDSPLLDACSHYVDTLLLTLHGLPPCWTTPSWGCFPFLSSSGAINS